MTGLCTRPLIETHALADGRTYDQCRSCLQISQLDDQGRWSERHRDDAAETQAEIERGSAA